MAATLFVHAFRAGVTEGKPDMSQSSAVIRLQKMIELTEGEE
ncbi:hypothetical protein [Sodalis glossinidius]|nr:hypothetical protein [Sodalis glossinidius]